MTCGCMATGGAWDGISTKRPTTRCAYCAEKHFATAYALAREAESAAEYAEADRAFVIGELVLAQWHLGKDSPAAAALREARHLVQARRAGEVDWGMLLGEVGKSVEAARKESVT